MGWPANLVQVWLEMLAPLDNSRQPYEKFFTFFRCETPISWLVGLQKTAYPATSLILRLAAQIGYFGTSGGRRPQGSLGRASNEIAVAELTSCSSLNEIEEDRLDAEAATGDDHTLGAIPANVQFRPLVLGAADESEVRAGWWDMVGSRNAITVLHVMRVRICIRYYW
jgi:hypothetical protein